MRGAVFPWRDGNRFELLIDGPQFFPQMLVGIARAERQVELELYLVEAGACAEAMVQALVLAAERGVRVRCLFDDYGSLAFTLGLRKRLTDVGVELRFYNRLSWRRWMRNLYRDRRRTLTTLIAVGAGIAAIVLLALVTAREAVFSAWFMAAATGVLLMLAGALGLGTYIKVIPYPVTVGFTAGIAVIIFASQVREMMAEKIAQLDSELSSDYTAQTTTVTG